MGGNFNNPFYFFWAGGGKGVAGVSDLGWHHYAVVATHGQTDPIFYIDGSLRPINFSFGSNTITLFPSTLPLHIGAQVDTFDYFGKHSIDELSIYNRALSASEIQAISDAGVAGKCKGDRARPLQVLQGQGETAECGRRPRGSSLG